MNNRRYALDDITWEATPSPAVERFIPIYSAQPNATISLTIVCPGTVSVPTHWLSQRTIPCVGKEKGCEGCAQLRTVRTKVYLGCWEPSFSRLALLEVTGEGVANCNVKLTGPGLALRGLKVRAWRIGKARNAPMRCEVTNAVAGEQLPDEFDLKEALLRVWNGKARAS